MTFGQLVQLVKIAESLNVGEDTQVYRDDSRDGNLNITTISGQLRYIGPQEDKQIHVVFS